MFKKLIRYLRYIFKRSSAVNKPEHSYKEIEREVSKRKINKIIIHCSATPPSMDIGINRIRRWHLDRGFSDIGYNDVITRNGDMQVGRDVNIAGAHCIGHNKDSIGICLVGGVDEYGNPENNFTEKQFKALRRLLVYYSVQYKKATIHGHNEFSSKACPGFNVQEWLKEINWI